MTKYIKVKDHNNLARDVDSNGLVNTDYESYSNYVNTYTNKLKQIEKEKNYENELKSLKNEMSEIKELLKKLIV